jgi:hypothetical protein
VFDLASSEVTVVPSCATHKDQMNERIHCDTRREAIPMLSTPDGRHAVAFYTSQTTNFWAYYTWDVPSDDPSNACGKVTAFFKHAAEMGRTYEYRTFVIVGDFATVKASVWKLHTGKTTKTTSINSGGSK